MARSGCDAIGLLISRYVDGEATAGERETVDRHVAGCDACACKLTEFMEMAAIFSVTPFRSPQPELRRNVMREVEHSRIRQTRPVPNSRERGKEPYSGTPPQGGASGFFRRLVSATGPFVVAGGSVVAILLLVLLTPREKKNDTAQVIPVANYAYPAVPTIPATIVYPVFVSQSSGDVPQPLTTAEARVPGVASPAAPPREAHATATLANKLLAGLRQPSPVLEAGDAWHTVEDPAYGYTVSYPPNWWTQSAGKTRRFYPWVSAARSGTPYWIELTVSDNPNGLTAESANRVMFAGSCSLVQGPKDGPLCLRRSVVEGAVVYDEMYAFEATHIYSLRAAVPRTARASDFRKNWTDAESVLATMSRKMSFAPAEPGNASMYGQYLFLSGGDLWRVGVASSNARAIYRGYGSTWVRNYAVTADMKAVAVAVTGKADDLWAQNIYLVRFGADGAASQTVLWSSAEIHDIVWYSDRELLVVARSAGARLGLYKLSLDANLPNLPARAALLTGLDSSFTAARNLSLSPDRQWITFLAPLGENKGTDLYAVRPDGSGLAVLVPHSEPLSPNINGQPVFEPGTQALKQYSWIDQASSAGYAPNILVTCGNAQSPTFYRGGYLYAASSASEGPAIDAGQYGIDEPESLQIVHAAYSNEGRVAFTGYFNLRSYRAEVLAGLWVADLVGGKLLNVLKLPAPESPRGVSDLQWSADGRSLLYRETIPGPGDFSSLISQYDGRAAFNIVRLDLDTLQRSVLFESGK